MKIIILCENVGFPIGLAGTARVRCFAKALKETGHFVEVINTVGLLGSYTKANISSIGIFDGIPYRFCGGYSVRPKIKFGRLAEKIIGYIVSLLYILSKKNKEQLDCIILYSRNIYMVRIFGVLSKIIKIPFVVELCEWPEAIALTKGSDLKKSKAFSKAVIKYASAVIPISHYIQNRIKQLCRHQYLPSCIIPVLFDIPLTSSTSNKPYILYTGSADYADIWKIVIDTIVHLHARGVDITLVLTCSGSYHSVNNLKNYIANKKMASSVKYLGYVKDAKFNELINNANILFAPLPDNLQSIARFPTKLAFYLASGRPVLTSNVGEVNYYLKDGENAFVVSKECKIKELAEKICQIYENHKYLEQIGDKGRRVAYQNFYYKSQGSKLSDFIEFVIKNYKR